MPSDTEAHGPTPFRTQEKRYKYKKSRPEWIDLDDVIDLRCKGDNPNIQLLNEECFDGNLPLSGRCPAIYKIIPVQGLFVMKNPFTEAEQLDIVSKCLCEYPQPPNPTNISNLARLEDRPPPPLPDSPLLYTTDLRWATLGYHHNWDTREYSETYRTAMPPEMVRLAGDLHTVWRAVVPCDTPHRFLAQAGIINWYNLDSTLAGHVDDSEECLHHPIFSASFGCDAIFLISLSKSVKPTALRLRSGDVCVLSGPSRLAVHGVPRIIANTSPPFLWESPLLPADLQHLTGVMRDRRINVSLRQVHCNPSDGFPNTRG